MRSKIILIILLTAIVSIPALGQKSIYSTYSRYGLGEIVEQSYGSNIGYGSITSGLRVDDVINYSNPASYTAQDTNSFIFDLGISANSSLQHSNTGKINRKAVGFDHIAIAFPVIRWWKSSIGVVPLSQVGYYVQSSSNPAQVEEMVTVYEGEGGVRQFYIGNAFDLSDHFHVGFNYFYLFGNTSYKTVSYLPQDSYSGQFEKKRMNVISGSRFQLGLQYTTGLFGDYTLTTGATYNIKAGLNVEHDREFFSFYQYTDQSGRVRQDTIDKVNSSATTHTHYPSGYSAGFTLENAKLIMGADFKYQKWSEAEGYPNLSDSYSIHGGVQYTPEKEALRNYFRRINYRVGGYYKQSYLRLNNHNLKDYGITFGLGLPLKYNKTKFNISLQLGRKGTQKHDLIEENYAIVNFNITFYDFWFIKQKYQ